MQTLTTIIARCGHDQDASPSASADGVGQDRVGGPLGRKLATAHIDDPSSVLRGNDHRPRQVELRARGPGSPAEPWVRPHGTCEIAEDRHNHPAAVRSNSRNRALNSVLSEDQARRQCTVCGGIPTGPWCYRRCDLDHCQARSRERDVGLIDGPIEHGDDDPGVALRLCPEVAEPGDRQAPVDFASRRDKKRTPFVAQGLLSIWARISPVRSTSSCGFRR
jgi:hypothetical protein